MLLALCCTTAIQRIVALSVPCRVTGSGVRQVAERHTWPNIALIHSQCQLEIVLDDCVRCLAHEARGPMVCESKQTHAQVVDGAAAGVARAAAGRQSLLLKQRHTHMDLSAFFGTATVCMHATPREKVAVRKPST
jgi:hypothetical protein